MVTAATPPIEQPVPDDPEQNQPEQDQEQEAPNYGEWNEALPEELQTTLVKLAENVCNEFKYPRRLEVMKAWKARMFWREMQHLKWNWGGECWEIMFGPAGYNSQNNEGDRDSALLYSTNMYQGFGESFMAIITQSVPNVRFEPEDPEEPADMETAKAAEPLRKLIQHENDPIKLMTKAAYYAWTDGRIHGWTRWEVDKRTNTPREMQTIEGSMEVKIPVIYEEDCEYPYLQYSKEYHVSTVREKVRKRAFPVDYWKKIKGGSSGNGQDVYERTARISVKQGISMRSAGGDAYSHLVTTQRTWMRPSILMGDTVEEDKRDQLESLFPHGIYVEVDNGVYTGSRDATMDDEWVVENIMEGDGSFRNAKGTCLISVQERVNDLNNATQDVYEKTLPASYWDDKLFDIDGMKRQRSSPGARYGVNMSELPAGDTIAAHFAFEPTATVSADMLQFTKELMTDVPEFLTGISSILFGADTGGDKSGKALSIQQAAAMGRVGLPFRTLKRFYARMMEQAVRCSARNRKSDWRMGIRSQTGEIETVAVRVGDLNGKVRCFANADENYPESWISKRNTYMQLMLEGNTDPTLKAILANPENQNLAKKLIGLEDLTLPDENSWRKQMVEINLLLAEPPNVVQPPPAQVPNPLQPETIETIQPPPTTQSTIPIDPVYDNNAAEFLTVVIWINSQKGQEAKKANPKGFENVRLHGLEHKQALQAQTPPPVVPPVPPHRAAPHAAPAPGGAPPMSPPSATPPQAAGAAPAGV
ncbi:hypothetical protein KGP36_03305 [Patescibacteria group bacterium]|nr:hypothetical protein [Patescibacteria group bacterium]